MLLVACCFFFFFFFNDTATTEIYTLSLHDALPISFSHCARGLNAHGISVAVPTYDLCPAVTVADIIMQMRMASRELATLGQSLVVSGHSAGGHLAACL